MIPSNLMCEFQKNAFAIQRKKPVFSWNLLNFSRQKQTAYRILVSSSKKSLNKNQADMWDSEEVKDFEHSAFYNGLPLESSSKYYWTVKVLTDGKWSNYSPFQEFETALLDESDWQGKWIAMPSDSRAVGLFRTEQKIVGKIIKARAYLASDGFVELHINGDRVGNEILQPVNSDSKKHVFYSTYDIVDYLNQDDNVIGVMLGSGWSTHPRFLLQCIVWFEDGRIVKFGSDFKNWCFMISPILSATIYSGEVYNALYEKEYWCTPGEDFYERYHYKIWNFYFDYLPAKPSENLGQYQDFGDAYFDVMIMPPPGGELVAQAVEPIRETEIIVPIKMLRTPSGGYIFDFGQNFAGSVRIKMNAERHTSVKILYSEILNDNNTLNMEYLKVSDPYYPLPMQCDEYIFSEGSVEYQPRFTYHGFRYVNIEGDIKPLKLSDICGIVMHSDVERTGFFSCGNDLVNTIQSCIIWTERSNLYGIPTDCCQRSERQGWLNDMTVRTESAVYNFNLNKFLEKFQQDISDTQDLISGAIADTAPFRRGNFPGDAVNSTYLIIPQLLNLFYGNGRVIKEYYLGMKKWVEFLEGISRDNVVTFSLYGDWASPITNSTRNGIVSAISNITPGEFVSTGYYYMNLTLMATFADYLNLEADKKVFEEKSECIQQALNEKFFNKDTAQYCMGSQGSNVFALYIGIVPDEFKARVALNIVKDVIENEYHVTTGNLMTKYILEVLSEYGHTDIAFEIVTQTTYPSWGHMIENGATTIWERWEYETGYGMNSHNHPMHGSISTWFYKYLAGIKPLTGGFRRFEIKPHIPKKLSNVNCLYKAVSGDIKSSWEKPDDALMMKVEIPGGTEAEICVPISDGVKEIRCNDVAVWSMSGKAEDNSNIALVSQEREHVRFLVQSGYYTFRRI